MAVLPFGTKAGAQKMETNVSMRPGPASPLDFGARTIEFVCETLQADWGCFYLLDAAFEPNTFCARGVPKELYLGYIDRNMRECDPLHPGRLNPKDQRRFTLLSDPNLQFPVEQRHRYWKFLSSFGVRHTGEMVFRHQGRAIAGLSLLWRKKAVLPESAGFGMSVHSYVEFNAGTQWSWMQVPDVSPQLGLTVREREVVQLACSGCTNADIARRLKIGVATVKTHLINIFNKAGVSNRAALVNRMLTGSGSARLSQ